MVEVVERIEAIGRVDVGFSRSGRKKMEGRKGDGGGSDGGGGGVVEWKEGW